MRFLLLAQKDEIDSRDFAEEGTKRLKCRLDERIPSESEEGFEAVTESCALTGHRED